MIITCRRPGFLAIILIWSLPLWGCTLTVGPGKDFIRIADALKQASDNDTVMVFEGTYAEGTLTIRKKIIMIGIERPIIDGGMKGEVLAIKSSDVIVKGFRIIRSGSGTLDDPAGIRVYNVKRVILEDNELVDNFFGIYLQYSSGCVVRNNKIMANASEEQKIGNGIHCWKSDSLTIIGNKITGHRDGIYFEFVTHSLVWRNISKYNLRYGLHFMFSNDDDYINNVFVANGAGVAVMYTKNVLMYNNTFAESRGDASYGILLKDISDAEIIGNIFTDNTSALYLEGANRMVISKNTFRDNGWGLKIQANCMDNVVQENNFISNTFDVSTNGSLVLNTFKNNYWDKYEGYDLNKDACGDVPYRPLSLYAVVIENNPVAMLLFRSFMISLLERTEKLIPSITPESFRDDHPKMKPLDL